MLRLLGPLVALLAACATSPGAEDPFDAIDPGADGGADGAGFPVLDVEPGDQLTLEVTARPAGKAIEELELADHVVAVRVHGGPAAVIVRRTSGDLDPYAIVKDRAKQTLAHSVDQVVAPAADARDAIVTVASADQLVLISGEDLASGGTFRLDVVAVASTLALEGTPARIVGETLRAREPERAELVGAGWISERADGGLEPVAPTIPLAERARVATFVHELGEAREALFAELGGPPTGASLAAIWRATEAR